jgi:hypothetical protein
MAAARPNGGRVASTPLVVGPAVTSNPLRNCQFLLWRIALERPDVVTASTPCAPPAGCHLGIPASEHRASQERPSAARGGWPSRRAPTSHAAAASTAPTSTQPCLQLVHGGKQARPADDQHRLQLPNRSETTSKCVFLLSVVVDRPLGLGCSCATLDAWGREESR